MSQPETVISNAIRLALGKHARHVRLFRNHRSIAWVGKRITSPPGLVVLENACSIRNGLSDGAGDLVGWVSVIVTPDMVGQRLAIFASPDVKVPGARKPPENQFTWRDNVLAAGGIAGFVHSPDEALALIRAAPGRPA